MFIIYTNLVIFICRNTNTWIREFYKYFGNFWEDTGSIGAMAPKSHRKSSENGAMAPFIINPWRHGAMMQEGTWRHGAK